MIPQVNIWKSIKKFLINGGLIAITALWVLPVIWMFISTLRDPGQPYYFGLLPSNPTLVNYKRILSDPMILISLRNSAVVASATAAFVLVVAFPAAYGFSRFRFKGKNSLQILLLIIRLFPGVILAITLFQVAGLLNVYDTFIPLILANGLLLLPFAIWNIRTLFENMPIEIEESAWIDGTTRLGGIVRVILPLMSPGIIATGAFAFLLTWNEYLFAVSFIRSPNKQLITTTIAGNIGQFNIDFIGLTTTAMIASLPLLVIFFFVQRYIVSGLGMGAVKG